MNHKKLIGALTTVAIVAILLISLFFGLNISGTNAASPFTYTPGNVTVGGVLATDGYVLFPWVNKSLTIGFSKYGEMIDTNTVTGLDYNGKVQPTGTDPFAPFGTLIPTWQWIEGWVLNITYSSTTGYANVWALALHSDYYNGSSVDGGWVEGVKGGALNLAYLGGRKTSGGAYTAPIQVLYNGPREFIALCNTTIFEDSACTLPLVRLLFTIIFNKDTKQVVILKDLKRIDYGKNYGPMEVEFGDRGEWDLGAPPSSGAHKGIPFSSCYIFENQTTSYNDEYQSWYANAPTHFDGTYDVAQIISNSTPQFVGWAAFWPKPISTYVAATEGTGKIDRQGILSSLSTKTDTFTAWANGTERDFTTTVVPCTYPQSNGTGIFWESDPLVFVGTPGNLQLVGTNGTTSPPYNGAWYSPYNHTVEFPTPLGAGTEVVLVYEAHHYQDTMAAPLGSPFIIGEWAFVMDAPGEIFRGVTVYGVTDRNDGNDGQAPANPNKYRIDSEVQYFLDSIFNPFDLRDAVEKQDFRWVQFFSGDGTTTSFELMYNETTDGTLLESPPGVGGPSSRVEWDEYSSNAERILVNGVLQAPAYAITRGHVPSAKYNVTTVYNYTITWSPWDDHFWINFTTPPPVGTPVGTKNIKVLYSTEGPAYLIYYGEGKSENVQERGEYEWIVAGRAAATVDSIAAAYVTEAFDSIKHIDVLKTGLDFCETTYGPNVPWVMAQQTTGAPSGSRSCYYDSIGRPYLKDDWCTTYPVSSSNMITVGSVYANLAAEYFQEMSSVLIPQGKYVVNNTLGQADKIFLPTCWSHDMYYPNATMGYGVISVYQDLNGTTGLQFYGYNGQDTYYVTNWFWNYPAGIPLPKGYSKSEYPNGLAYSGIQYLQNEDCGVTSIVLQINYATHTSTIGGILYHFDAHHPEITICHNERLGTISEKGQHDP
jgi:hypothetical protein